MVKIKMIKFKDIQNDDWLVKCVTCYVMLVYLGKWQGRVEAHERLKNHLEHLLGIDCTQFRPFFDEANNYSLIGKNLAYYDKIVWNSIKNLVKKANDKNKGENYV